MAGRRGTPSAIRRFLKMLGPGLITGASDDDPSGIGTYSVAGASLGFSTLWTALFTFPMMAAIQFIAAKIALVSGRGLAGVLRRHYSPLLLYPIVFSLVIANTINAGADIGAIAAAVNLLLPIKIIALIIPIGALILALHIWMSYRLIANIFSWLALSLFAYIGVSFFVHVDWRELVRGTLLPSVRFDSAYLSTLVAILGTTISPYLFFWLSSQELEEKIAHGHTALSQRRGATEAELRYAAVDVNIGMFFSNVVMYFIIFACAATLFKAGHRSIEDAAQAAVALEPLAGHGAKLMFALGLIGSGFLAVPILTGSGAYALSEAFGWKWSLGKRLAGAPQFYAVIAASTLVGMQINFMGINPISALYWTAVIYGFLSPPLLVMLMIVANNKAIMGSHRNGIAINILGWATTAVMFAAAIGLVLTWGR